MEPGMRNVDEDGMAQNEIERDIHRDRDRQTVKDRQRRHINEDNLREKRKHTHNERTSPKAESFTIKA